MGGLFACDSTVIRSIDALRITNRSQLPPPLPFICKSRLILFKFARLIRGADAPSIKCPAGGWSLFNVEPQFFSVGTRSRWRCRPVDANEMMQPPVKDANDATPACCVSRSRKESRAK